MDSRLVSRTAHYLSYSDRVLINLPWCHRRSLCFPLQDWENDCHTNSNSIPIDNHYCTLFVHQFEYNNTSTDPEAWCFCRSALEGLRKTIGIGDEEPEELQNLLYSNLGPIAQADWQRFTLKCFYPEALNGIKLDVVDDRSNGLEKRRSYKLKLCPYRTLTSPQRHGNENLSLWRESLPTSKEVPL
jgi:hypothetical protein